MATKLVAVVFAIIFASCTAEDICSEFQDNCNAYSDDSSTYQCLISCADGSGPCVGNGNCPDIATTPINYGQMDGQKCKETCEADTANKCAFYRYDFVESKQTKMCYLMNEDQCDDEGNGCIDPQCASGPANCDGGGYVKPPEKFTCLSGTQHSAGTIPNFNLHWNCKDVNNNMADHDITSETPAAPGNTVCTAKPDCSKNDQKQHYVYKCVQKSGGAPTEGEWQWENDGTSDPQLVETEEGPNKGKLKEATCNAEPLAVSNYVDQVTRGMEILCVGDPIDTESKIPAQNSCILICDGYPILNFYTKMAEWKYTMMDDPSTENTFPDPADPTDVIYCHK